MLESSRILLRRFKIEDAEKVFKNWTSDPEVSKYVSWETHKDVDVTKEWLNYVIDGKKNEYVIIYKENNEPIGSIAVMHEPSDYSSCEIGYCLSKEYWNKGIMSEVLTLLVGELFTKQHYKVIYARHDLANGASGKVMENCGFHKSFIGDELHQKNGPIDIAYYSITYEEYKIKRLAKEIKDKIGADVYLTSTIDDFLVELQGANVAFLEVDMIDSPKIKKVNDLQSYNFHVLKDGIRKYYFISLIKDEHRLKAQANYFIELNKPYFISLYGKTIEKLIVDYLRKKGLHISFAESCTGGLLASTIINVPGASNVINESLVTYAESSKERLLGVERSTLNQYTVYSKEVAKEMAEGLYNITKAEVCVSITGRAGGEEHDPKDGSYDFCILLHKNLMDKKEYLEHKQEHGTRNEVRKKQVNFVLFTLYSYLQEYFNE